MDAQKLLNLLDNLSGSGDNYKASCPAHTDSRASLSILMRGQDTPYLKCHAGCEYKDIMRALEERGLPVEKEVRYEYQDESGEVMFTKVRKPGKNFFIEGKVRPILFNLPALLRTPDRLVFVVEGEKDASNLGALGFLATTGYEGSNKWREEYSQVLAGRTVCILPDNDEPGAKYGQKVSTSLLRSGCKVKLIPMSVLYALLGQEAPVKSDVSDWLVAGGTDEQLRDVCRAAPYLTNNEINRDPLSEDLTEQYVIAHLLLQPESKFDIFSVLQEFEFSSYHCRKVYATAFKLYQATFSIDRATVSSQLDDDTKQYLDKLLSEILPAGSVSSHVTLVKAAHSRRSLIYQCGEISRLAQDPKVDTDDLLDQAESRVMSLRGISGVSEVPDISVGVIAALKAIEARVGQEEGLSGLATGLSDLDAYTDGLQKSDLVLLAGRPGMGKTALAMNIVEHAVLREDRRVMMFSLEMSTTQLVTRILSSITGVDSQKLRRGTLTPRELTKLTEEASRLSKSKLVIDDTSSISINQLRTRARRAHKKSPLSLIVIDYLQLMRGSNNQERRERELAEISSGLKALAKELDIPILALSQLNRALEARTDKRPNNSDLRESGALEQDADIILFVYRECVYNEEASQKLAELIVSKHRNGPLGSIILEFNGALTKFSDLTEPSNMAPVTEEPEERAAYNERDLSDII